MEEVIAEDLKDGDIVCLKSGGPKMTVDRVLRNSDYVECIWFVRNIENLFQYGDLNRGKFVRTSLEIVKE